MKLLRILAFWVLLLPTLLRAQDESTQWDWFGYNWDGEYFGNLFDGDGVCRGRIFWLDYNNIVTISQAFLPAYSWHYNRLKGFGLGTEWTGRLYRDDTPVNAIPMNWTFIPMGDVAWIRFRYQLQVENGPPITIDISGWLRKRW